MDEAYFDILFLVTISIAFAVRVYPLMRGRIKNVDNYYHLLASRQIWNERRLPDRLNGFLFEGTYSYPPMFHVLLSPIAGKIDEKKEKVAFIVAPAMDILSAAIIYLVVGDVLGKPVALVSALLYVITPLLIIESLTISPRTLGAFFLNLYMLLIFLYAHDHNYWLLLPASIVCIPCILLTHKMASQSLLFVLIPSSIIFVFFDPWISAFVVISFIAGISFTFLVSKGFYRRVFRGHKAMLLYHFRHGNYKGEKKYGNALQILQRWPWIPLLLFTAFIGHYSQAFAAGILVPLTWGVIFIALTLLWKYGDNYRYLVYAIAPLSIAFGTIIYTLPTDWFVATVTISIVLSALRVIIFFFRRLKRESLLTKDLLNCFSYVKLQREYASLGCVPVSINYPALYYSEKAILGAEAAPEPWERGQDLSIFYKDENLLIEFISKYGTNLYLVNRADPTGVAFESLLKNSTQIESKILHSSGSYSVYELHCVPKPS